LLFLYSNRGIAFFPVAVVPLFAIRVLCTECLVHTGANSDPKWIAVILALKPVLGHNANHHPSFSKQYWVTPNVQSHTGQNRMFNRRSGISAGM